MCGQRYLSITVAHITTNALLQDVDGQIDLLRRDAATVAQEQWRGVHEPSASTLATLITELPRPSESLSQAHVVSV